MPRKTIPARDQRDLDIERRSRRLRTLEALTFDAGDVKARLSAPPYAVKFLLVTIEARIGREDAWTLSTTDLMRQTCLPKGTFYKAWDSLVALDLIIAEEQPHRGKGWHRLRICWPNLEDLVRPSAAGRRGSSLANPEPADIVSDGGDSVPTRDDPVPGGNQVVPTRDYAVSGRNQPVPGGNCQSLVGTSQSLPETDTVLTLQSFPSSPPPSSGNAWVVVEQEMFAFGIVETLEPLRSLQDNQVSPSLARAVLRLARETGAWKAGKVRRRLLNLRPGDDPRNLRQKWPPADHPERLSGELVQLNQQERQRKLKDRDQRLRELEERFGAHLRGRTTHEIAAEFEVPEPLRSRLVLSPQWGFLRNDDIRLRVLEHVAAAIEQRSAVGAATRGT